MGRDKATVRFRGSVGEITFVEQVVATLRSRCKAVFVIAARGQALPDLDAEVLRDATPGVGPLLATARGAAPGPYQLEAAIQSAHTRRRLGDAVPADALVLLYDALVALRGRCGGVPIPVDALVAHAHLPWRSNCSRW